MSRIDDFEKSDLVRRLSPEGVNYFATTEIEDRWASERNFRMCKFVRLGDVVFLGSTIEYGPESRRRSLFHATIAKFALENLMSREERMDAAEVARSEGALHDGLPLVDAGTLEILVGEEGTPSTLLLLGQSKEYGRADAAGREKTVAIAQEAADPFPVVSY